MKKAGVWAYLVRRIKKRIPAIALMSLAQIGSSVLGVVFALGTRNVVNTAVAGVGEAFRRACWHQAAIILGLLFCHIIYRYLHDKLLSRLDRDWKSRLFRSIIQSDYARASAYHSGELLNRLNNDVRTVNEGLLGALPGFLSMLVRLVAVLVVLWTLAPAFTVGLIVLGILVVAATAVVRRRLKAMHKAVSEAEGEVSGFLQESLEKLLIVQAMDVQPELEKRAEKTLEHRYRLQRRRQKMSLCAGSFVSILAYGSGFAALVWCAFGVYSGTMSFGDLTAVTQLVAQLQAPMVNLSGIMPKYIAMTAALERLMETDALLTPRESMSEEERNALYEKTEALECRELGFSYGREELLRSCDFSLPKGSFTVVLGPSGIGKSTLLKLMLGIFTPERGSLTLRCPEGETPLGKNTRGLFAYVPQGNLIFSGSIRDNLTLTRPEATEEEIAGAVRASGMDLYLSALPLGLDTPIGENARGLSEGQAQRLAIGRAVLGGAPILLLDEASSALDEETEMLVMERLRALPGRTIIAVTHRSAPASLADVRLEAEGGVIRRRDAEPGE